VSTNDAAPAPSIVESAPKPVPAAASKPAVSGPTVSEPAAAEPAIAKPAAAEPAAAKPAFSEPAASRPATSGLAATGPAAGAKPTPAVEEPIAAVADLPTQPLAADRNELAADRNPAAPPTATPPAATPLAADPVVADVTAAEVAASIPAVTPGSVAVADDLTRIAGIGPKIAAALAGAGITTYGQLAETDVPTLRAAITGAGLRLAPSLPTWPERAKQFADAS
jgi:predicted flap endonuclease-1-like 5' DNA nuclease